MSKFVKLEARQLSRAAGAAGLAPKGRMAQPCDALQLTLRIMVAAGNVSAVVMLANPFFLATMMAILRRSPTA